MSERHWDGIPRNFSAKEGAPPGVAVQTPRPVPREDLMDIELSDAQFLADYQDRPRRFNPLLYGTMLFRKFRNRAIDYIIGP